MKINSNFKKNNLISHNQRPINRPENSGSMPVIPTKPIDRSPLKKQVTVIPEIAEEIGPETARREL